MFEPGADVRSSPGLKVRRHSLDDMKATVNALLWFGSTDRRGHGQGPESKVRQHIRVAIPPRGVLLVQYAPICPLVALAIRAPHRDCAERRIRDTEERSEAPSTSGFDSRLSRNMPGMRRDGRRPTRCPVSCPPGERLRRITVCARLHLI